MIGLCVAAAMLAAGCLGRPPRPRSARLAWVIPVDKAAAPGPAATVAPSVAPRLVIATVMVIAGVVTIGGPLGAAVGLVAAAIVVVVRPQPAALQPNLDDIPVVVDLVAGCLAAGASLADALDAASVAADDVTRVACCEVAAALRSGAPPEEAWRAWLVNPHLAPVARTAVRTSQTGAAAAADLSRTSTRLRAQRRAAAQHRVRQASVWLVVPLGLCFLPAFVLVAVVPLVVGLLPSLR